MTMKQFVTIRMRWQLVLVLVIATTICLGFCQSVKSKPINYELPQDYITDSGPLSTGVEVFMNRERASHSLKPLLRNTKLTASATAKCADMAKRDYWAHNTPNGDTPWSFIIRSGYSYHTAGENLASRFATSQGVVNGWINSPEHEANILNTSYTDVGTAVCQSPNYIGQGFAYIVVEHYGSSR